MSARLDGGLFVLVDIKAQKGIMETLAERRRGTYERQDKIMATKKVDMSALQSLAAITKAKDDSAARKVKEARHAAKHATLAQDLLQANAPAEKSKPEVCPSSVHAKALAVFKADGALHKADGAIVFALCALLEAANEAGAIESDGKRAAVITDLKAVYKTMPTVAAKRARVIQQAAYIAFGRTAKRKADGSFSEAMEAQGWEVVQECFKVSTTIAALAKALTACLSVQHGAVGKVKPKGDSKPVADSKGADAPLVLPGKADAAKAALLTILSAYQNTFTVASKDGKLIAAIDTTMQLLKAA